MQSASSYFPWSCVKKAPAVRDALFLLPKIDECSPIFTTSFDAMIAQAVDDRIGEKTIRARIAEIQNLAVQVFVDVQVGMAWLVESNLATCNKPPFALLGYEEGFRIVQNLLLRIQFGVPA